MGEPEAEQPVSHGDEGEVGEEEGMDVDGGASGSNGQEQRSTPPPDGGRCVKLLKTLLFGCMCGRRVCRSREITFILRHQMNALPLFMQVEARAQELRCSRTPAAA